MKLTKLFVAAAVLLAAAGAAFADEAKYNELLAKGKDYEAKKQWVYAMGTYWDAILEYPQGAKDANDGFNRIRAGFAEYNESVREFIVTGNPGPGEYDIFSCYDGWINVCKEFEVYWNEHSDEIYYVPDVECEKGEANMKNRTMTYKFKGTLAFTPKFSTIWGCIRKSFRIAHRNDWDDIPAQWPAVSMFKDSKTIPVVKFISACNDKAFESKTGRKYEVLTRSLKKLYKYTVVGGYAHDTTQVDFPPYERKAYYVAAWNNEGAIAAPDKILSNREIKIKILDKNGRIIGSNNASGTLTFEISGISSDDMKILDSGEWSYKVESIVIKSKNASAEIKKPISLDCYEQATFDSVKYTNGPVINMYRKGNHTDALVEYEAAPFAKGLCNNCRIDKTIQKILRNCNQRNYYGYFCSEDTVDGEVFVLPLTGKNELVQKLGYAGDVPANISVETTIRFGKEEFKSDDFFELMNKMYNAEFNFGYNRATKEYCIYSTTIPDEIRAAAKKAEEARLAAEKAEEERIAAEKARAELLLYSSSEIVSKIDHGAKTIKLKGTYSASDLEYINKALDRRYRGESVITLDLSEVEGMKNLRWLSSSNCASIYLPKDIESINAGREFEKIIPHPESSSVFKKDEVLYTNSGTVVYSVDRNIKNAKIIDGVIKINSRAFSYCKRLTSVALPNTIDYIGSCAFEGCELLDTVTIPSSVTAIDYKAFEGCTSLTSVTIPSSVTSIGYNAFKDCTSLKTVYYAGSKNDWKKIKIYNENKGNKPLLKAKIIYGKK